MDEAVLLAAFGRDETEALGVIEPLDRAGGAHCSYSLLCCNRSSVMPHLPDYAMCVTSPSRRAAADRQHNQKGSRRDPPQPPVPCPGVWAPPPAGTAEVAARYTTASPCASSH